MSDKRRLVGPSGAIFVPNVPADTVEFMLKTGQWSELPESAQEPEAPRKGRPAKPKN